MARVVEPDGGGSFSNAGSQAAAGAATQAVNAPSGSSAAAVTSPGATPPNEGLYGQYQAQALDAFNKAKIALQQKRSGIFQNFGFNQDGTVDGNNSVGGYQQMKHAQALELQAAENQAQERHLGAHGLGAQVANAPRFQEDVDSANFGRDYLSALDSNSADLSGAEGTYQQALVDARRLQIEDDIANRRYDVADPEASTDVADFTPNPTADATPSTRAVAAATRLIAATTNATTRQTARSTEKAPAKKPAPKPVAYLGRH